MFDGNLKPEERLRDALGFDEADLEANRRGKLSKRQAALFSEQTRKYRRMALGSLPVSLAVFVAALLIGLSVEQVVVISAVLLFLVMFLFANLWNEYMFYRSLATSDAVACARGRIQASQQTTSIALKKASIIVHNENFDYFDVSEETLLFIRNGEHYAIYYEPNTRKLLSVEWLGETSSTA